MLDLNRQKINSIPCWSAFIRIAYLLTLIHFIPGYALQTTPTLHNVTDNSTHTKCNDEHSQLKLYKVLLSPEHVCSLDDEAAELNQKSRRPKCTAGKGCDIPLHCYNYTTSDSTLGVPQVMSVTPMELQSIVENQNISNNCVMVMFYAPWCEHCVQFARRYNTVGRMFRELPVLAVDLSVNDPHKYVLAYLPVVAFYHQAKVIYRFKLTESIEELRDMIIKMTDFPALNVSTEDGESEGPVPVIRVKEEKPFLYFSVAWIVFVVLVFTVRTSRVSDCLHRLWRVRAA